MPGAWDPEKLGSIFEGVAVLVLEEIRDSGGNTREWVRWRSVVEHAVSEGAHPKSVETVLDGLIAYGVLRVGYGRGRTMSLDKKVVCFTTLGQDWAEQWLEEEE